MAFYRNPATMRQDRESAIAMRRGSGTRLPSSRFAPPCRQSRLDGRRSRGALRAAHIGLNHLAREGAEEVPQIVVVSRTSRKENVTASCPVCRS